MTAADAAASSPRPGRVLKTWEEAERLRRLHDPKPDPAPETVHGPEDGVLRTVFSAERMQLIDHFMRLDPEDLRRRFHGAMSSGALDAHVEEAFAPHRAVLGWYRHGVLRAAVELDEWSPVVEAAVTVEAAYRGKGIGKALLARAIERAAMDGAHTLAVHTTRSNAPMVGLAKSLDARIEADGPDVSGLIPCKRVSPMKVLFDLAADEAALARSVIAAQLNFWRGRAEKDAAEAAPDSAAPEPASENAPRKAG